MKIERVQKIIMEKRKRAQAEMPISKRTEKSMEKIVSFDEMLDEMENKSK